MSEEIVSCDAQDCVAQARARRVVVEGAPGSGKTVALALRVARLLEQGCAPADVLVVVPSHTHAATMRALLHRVAGQVGTAVEVDVRRDEEGGVRVAVMDRGPGLSAEAMEHVFERFWRADGALNSEKGGLGLGLAISHALAEDMDGSLSVTDREGGGCVFTLSIPAA